MKNSLWKYAAFLALALVSVSCEKEHSGLINPSVQEPLLASAAVSPAIANLDLTGGPVTPNGSSFKITLALSGFALSHGGPAVSNVRYRIVRPGEPAPSWSSPLASIRSGDTLFYSQDVSFSVNRVDIGVYYADLIASNAEGLSSGISRQSFTVTRNNSEPALAGLSAPDTVQIPAHGFSIFTLTVAAADSDGYTDLEFVSLRRVAPSLGPVIQMFDDGDKTVHGDLRVGDGVFSRTISIDSATTAGNFKLLFQARDRSGALSDSLTHQFTLIH